MHILIFLIIILAASLTNNLAGFGLALVSMPFLINLIGIQTATPLINLVAIVIQLSMVWRYRRELNPRAVRQLILPSLVAIPIGILSIDYLDETVLSTILGVVLLLYVAYRLLQRDKLRLLPAVWGYPLGFLGGLLGGAFNTSSPPVILYADTQGWSPSVFKVNLQTYFLFNGLIGLVTHGLRGNYTAEVGRYFLLALPVLLAGYLLGGLLDRLISQTLFRRGVLALLVILGLRLATTWI